MVSKNALLTEKNKHLEEKLEAQTQQLLHLREEVNMLWLICTYTDIHVTVTASANAALCNSLHTIAILPPPCMVHSLFAQFLVQVCFKIILIYGTLPQCDTHHFPLLQLAHKSRTIDDLSTAVKRLTYIDVHRSSAAQNRPFPCRQAAMHAHQAGVASESSRAMDDAQAAQPSAAPIPPDGRKRVDIPDPPVDKALTSIENVWKEYAEGTAGKPAIRHLINDHGMEWKQSRYNYDRKVWYKKSKIISALEALRHLRLLQPNQAISLLDKLRNRANKAVNAFASSLPNLKDTIDVSGKCKSSSGEWRRLRHGDANYDTYQQYLDDLRKFLHLDTMMV